MIEVRREDGELCGHVRPVGDAWQALVVFGSVLATVPTEVEAEAVVRHEALASLSDRWTLSGAGDDDGVVCIQEARPDGVRLALGYYSLPGVPSRWVGRDEIDAGEITLVHGSDADLRAGL